ncbi:hypothetical protein [Stenotrophomonas sp.]|uniref:hypothetical protein n=1 Tax=Stenotrophomonas sp. TaxID=69392 RepID=UPI0028AFDA3B|nr:hypothetical protein [Stenotrophomonas sp.]
MDDMGQFGSGRAASVLPRGEATKERLCGGHEAPAGRVAAVGLDWIADGTQHKIRAQGPHQITQKGRRMARVTVGGNAFEWALVSSTTEFNAFRRKFVGDEPVDVLRIWQPDTGFDIVIEVQSDPHPAVKGCCLRSILVIGPAFPDAERAATVGHLIELRPKLRVLLREGAPTGADVERILQWCMTRKFRALRVNVFGGRWTGPG